MPLHHPVSLSLSRNIASGGFVSGSGTGKAYPDKLTRNVVVTCIIASMAGFIFDYDIGISRNIASGGFVSGSGTGKAYPDKLTRNVVVTCIIASMGGFIFGYDLGISSIKRKTFECEEKVTNYHSLELKWSVKEEEATRARTSTNKSEGRELIMAKLFSSSNSPVGMFDARVMKPTVSRESFHRTITGLCIVFIMGSCKTKMDQCVAVVQGLLYP
ncbi:hypothetical protein RHMOL_Rhmol02G0276900 [Rhododendron molle]|uniref:Uncharacterized protein n=1 Tax=Rhododendron molle TaxID=49168 RepID=A0ACC0PWI3_RHOML|nr:hypothetical protein RHMOL_Rhmol02G0276900 [Rhododendron molle]